MREKLGAVRAYRPATPANRVGTLSSPKGLGSARSCSANQIYQKSKPSCRLPPSTVTNISHPPFHRDDHVHCRVISFVSSPPRRHHVGTVNPAFRACGWQCPQLSGANSDRIPPLDPLAATDKLIPPQRSTTSSSRDAASEAATSPFRLTVAGTAATAVAAGSMAWYYHLYGSTLYAMTPQEEGYDHYARARRMLC